MFNKKIIITLCSLGLATTGIATATVLNVKQDKEFQKEITQQNLDMDTSSMDFNEFSQGQGNEDEENFVMGNEFFGIPIEPEEEYIEPEPIKIDSSDLFVAPKTPTKSKSELLLEELNNSRNANSQTQIISYDEEIKDVQGSIKNLIKNPDYPNTKASRPYDLSRVLTTDKFIPAVMYTAVNSEIPSKTVTAIVESNVTGFHGKNILIPRGSKVEGVYEALDDKHARRMQISWFKITRPDGVIISLDSESSDSHGVSGMSGYLDQRLADRYGGAILLSGINALAQMSVNEDDIRQLAAVESFGREFGTLTAQIIKENLSAMPIISIRHGQRFDIRPHQNIYFPKYNSTNINALFVDIK